MKFMKLHRILPVMLTLSGLITISSCNSDSDKDEPQLPTYVVVDFEEGNLMLAGPTSYGENLYPDYAGNKFTSADLYVTSSISLHMGLNISSYSDKPDFSAGGVAISRWNNMHNTSTIQAANWWYTYENQCSIYNEFSMPCANQNAGADGSNTFAIIYGNNSQYGDFRPEISFNDKYELPIDQIAICPTAYFYGAVTIGNPFGSDPEKNLKEQKGWVKVLAYGFDAKGQPTNQGIPVEKYLCDFREGVTQIEVPISWIYWSLSDLGKVHSIKFDFEGSDINYGSLATPCYLGIDNIYVRVKD